MACVYSPGIRPLQAARVWATLGAEPGAHMVTFLACSTTPRARFFLLLKGLSQGLIGHEPLDKIPIVGTGPWSRR